MSKETQNTENTENGNDFIADVRRSVDMIYNKLTFNDWLDRNTKRNSFLTWEYKGKIYKGIDELRRIWQNEMDRHYA